MAKMKVKGTEVSVLTIHNKGYISLTDMLRAKDRDFLFLIGCAKHHSRQPAERN